MRNYIVILMIGVGVSNLGCSARPSGAGQNGRIINYTNCQLRKDQGDGSFKGAWAHLPIPLVLDRDFYVADEGEAAVPLRKAAATWNAWAGLRGMSVFNIQEDGTGRDIPEITSCLYQAYAAAVTDVVGIWKIGNNGFRRNQRESCGYDNDGKLKRLLYYNETDGSGVQGQTDWILQNKRIVGAAVLLNFEGYNSPGRQRIDVESLLLHELGHVVGLLHSCTASADDSTSAPNCDSAPDAYRQAVMFPWLAADQERRRLQQNDYDRINCIY